jgi:uncharacterized MAPEG superfamily protein
MRMKPLLISALSAVALTGCSPSEDQSQPSAETSTEIAQDAAPTQPNAKSGADPVKISIPQLAYSYKLTYLLPGDRVAAVQDSHRALCEQMGPARCQLLSLERGTGEDVHSQASTRLRVASGEARAFTDSMGKSVASAGGRNTVSNISTEEVSKAIVDTRARIAQRELLVARLTDLLRKRTGTVAELVEAERSVSQAQEELDQARGWLTELRGRVSMADFEIQYGAIAASASPESVGGQLGDATLGSATSFMITLRILLTMLIYLAPWALLAGLAWYAIGRIRRGAGTHSATRGPAADG